MGFQPVGGYSNPLFNSYGSNNYFNGYNSYSAFNSPYSSYGMMNATPSNSFLRAAEDNSRNAFQSIESVVHAFSAVSAMFESTFHAVYNSFRAVVGVADQFYRLKMHLSNILSAFALFKGLRYLARRLWRIIKRQKMSEGEDLWSSIASIDAESLVKDSKRYTNWPLVLFFGVVLGGPWLIWRILSSIDAIQKDDSLWMNGKIDHFVAVSEYDYDAENNDELSFKRGQKIIIAPKGKPYST
jgi:peroxin-13